MNLYEKVEYFIDLYASDENRIQFIQNLRKIMNAYAESAILLGRIPEAEGSSSIEEL